MRYLVLDNKENRGYKADLINSIIEGIEVGEYIKTDKGNFIKCNLKEVKRVKTNKTKVINSINVYSNKSDKDIKEVLRLKKLLKNRSVEDIESIKYAYEELIKLYYYSNIYTITIDIKYILEDTIKLILNSNVQLDNIYEFQKIKEWIKMGIN